MLWLVPPSERECSSYATAHRPVDDWKSATAIGADSVLSLPEEENALVAVLADHVDVSGDGTVVSVVGGCGGGGASATAAAVALTSAARHVPTLLVDVDALGSGADVLLGIETAPGLRWGALTVEGGRLSPDALRDALPAKGKFLRVLASSRREIDGPTSDRRSRRAGRRSQFRRTRGLRRATSSQRGRSGRVGDVGFGARGGSGHRGRMRPRPEKVGAWVVRHNSNVGLVVRGPAPGGLRGADVADMLGLPLTAVMRGHRSLAPMLERGGLELTRGCPLSVAATAVLDAVESGARPAQGCRMSALVTAELLDRVRERLTGVVGRRADGGHRCRCRASRVLRRSGGHGSVGGRQGAPDGTDRRGAARTSTARTRGRRRTGDRAGSGLGGPRGRPRKVGGPVHRRGSRASTGAAVGTVGRSTPRRRPTVGRRPPAGRRRRALRGTTSCRTRTRGPGWNLRVTASVAARDPGSRRAVRPRRRGTGTRGSSSIASFLVAWLFW